LKDCAIVGKNKQKEGKRNLENDRMEDKKDERRKKRGNIDTYMYIY